MTDLDAIRVLHVDDDRAFAELAATFLGRESDRIEVRIETDAEAGLAALATDDVDCVVSDYDMPGTDGIAFLEAVREDHADLPFVLYTGKGSEEVASEAISAGVTDYLQKTSGTDQYAVLANRLTNAVEASRSRRALEERNRTLRRYERMVNTMQGAACIYDEDGRFELVNEYLAEWYDTTCEALEGEPSGLIPQLGDGDDDPFQALLDGEREDIQGTIEAEFPGHGRAILDYRLTPLTVDGRIEGAVGVSRDVTERAERERELERRTDDLTELTTELERQYRHLFEEAPIMAVVTRLEDGVPVIEDCNRLFAETLGYERDDVVGETLTAFYTPSSSRKLIDRGGYDRALSGEFVREDRDLLTADGRTVEALLRAVPRYDARNERTGTLALYVDVSERKQLERQNAQLEEFTRIVSHDLRNPLTAARGHLELVREECVSDHLESVDRAHGRMETLIEDLLTLARSGIRVGETSPVDLATLAEETWMTVSSDEANGEATLETTTDRTVSADPDRLRQCLENLFHNAVEHGGEDVTVTVGDLEDGFFIEDDGEGIPPENREIVFEAGHSTSADGTGFGLGIVEGIAEAHGWQIRVVDGSAGGARFEITGVEFADG